MPSDLSQAIRDALHAGEISAADLRQPEPRQPDLRHRGRPGTPWLLAVTGAAAAVALVAVIMGVTRPGAPGQTPPATASTGSAAATTGTITGRLVAVGGPAGATNRALAGTVSITDTRTRHRESIPVGADGRYSIRVAPGTYLVEGHSPSYGDDTYPCQAAGPVQVTADATVRSDVTCQER
jgi:hypothetical protein